MAACWGFMSVNVKDHVKKRKLCLHNDLKMLSLSHHSILYSLYPFSVSYFIYLFLYSIKYNLKEFCQFFIYFRLWTFQLMFFLWVCECLWVCFLFHLQNNKRINNGNVLCARAVKHSMSHRLYSVQKIRFFFRLIMNDDDWQV